MRIRWKPRSHFPDGWNERGDWRDGHPAGNTGVRHVGMRVELPNHELKLPPGLKYSVRFW